ncbi:hypothetical protein DF3PB_5620004 [uncultured Defluviicoccus sp.]|uniref:Uncharacterized protein n=1 Tax=metagenome TaxID=256318 RepID=A0A380TIP9_9ZZZZ|nr:hypothetical protein DF3PB_5620004 [uncultured Defluviicoccus sp.]
MVTTPIAQAYAKKRRADKNIGELKKAISAFSRAHPPEIITHKLPNGALGIQFKTPEEPVSDDIQLILGDAIHNLRSSLDLMMVECFLSMGKGTSGVRFPFAQDTTQLEAIIKKDLAHGGQPICDLIRAMKPYKGGNIALRGLHDLDVSDKHKMLIPVLRQGLYHQVEFVIKINEKVAIRIKNGKILKDKTNPTTKIHSMETTAVLPNNYEGTAILFADSMPFAGEPVLNTLESLCQEVDRILKAFEKLVRR